MTSASALPFQLLHQTTFTIMIIFIAAKLPFLFHYSKQSYHNHFSKRKTIFSSCSCNKPVTLSFIKDPKHTNDQLICFQYLEKHPGGLSSRNVKLFMFQVMAITMFAILMINNQSSFVTVIPIPIYFCAGQHLLSLLEFHQLHQHCVTQLNPICYVFAYICSSTRTSALKNLTFPSYEFGKEHFTFYPVYLSGFPQKDKARRKYQHFIRGGTLTNRANASLTNKSFKSQTFLGGFWASQLHESF